MPVIERAPWTKALQAMLASATAKPIFVSRLPTDPAKIPQPPYAIVYPLRGEDYVGVTMAGNYDSGELVFQVTSVGLHDGADWMADRVRAAILGKNPDGSYTHDLSVPGWKCMSRRPDAGPGGASDADRGMVTMPETFVISVTAV